MNTEPPRLFEQLVAAGTSAPSSHNTQPWRFREVSHGIEIHADRSRALPVNDPHDRELTISCGAALCNLRLVAAHAQCSTWSSCFPILLTGTYSPGSPSPAGQSRPRRTTSRTRCWAGGTPGANRSSTGGSAPARRCAWPPRRHTTGPNCDGSTVPAENASRPSWSKPVASSPPTSGGGVNWPPGCARGVTATVCRWRQPAYRSPDGHLPVRLGAPPRSSRRRAPQAGATRGCPQHEHRRAQDWLVAGQALQRVLLTAASAGIFVGFANQPCQVGWLVRNELATAFGWSGYPQLVLRGGYPSSSPVPAPRRPLPDVLFPTGTPAMTGTRPSAG